MNTITGSPLTMMMTTTTMTATAPLATNAPRCPACRLQSTAACGGLGLNHRHGPWALEDLRLLSGDGLIEAGAYLDAAITVRTGVLKLERVTSQGERRILRLVGPGETIGLECLNGRPAAASAIALTDAAVCRLPATALRHWQASDPQGARRLLDQQSLALDATYHWAAEMQTGPLRQRLLRLLLECARLFNGPRIVLPSREDIGAMLGVTLETASRGVSNLRRSGVLTPMGRCEALIDMIRARQELQHTPQGA